MSAIITAVALTAVGTGVNAYSQYQAGKAQQGLSNYNAAVTQQAAEYNADVITKTADYNAELTTATADANAGRITKTADYNARVNELNAHTTLIDAATLANIQRLNTAHLMATHRAKFGASGVVGGTGSPLAVEVAQSGYAEMAALQTEHAGMAKSQGLMQEAGLTRWQGQSDAATVKAQALNDSNAMRWQAINQANQTRYTGGSQATLDRMSGNAARTAGNLGATGTLLQGAGKAVGQYNGFGG